LNIYPLFKKELWLLPAVFMPAISAATTQIISDVYKTITNGI